MVDLSKLFPEDALVVILENSGKRYTIFKDGRTEGFEHGIVINRLPLQSEKMYQTGFQDGVGSALQAAEAAKMECSNSATTGWMITDAIKRLLGKPQENDRWLTGQKSNQAILKPKW